MNIKKISMTILMVSALFTFMGCEVVTKDTNKEQNTPQENTTEQNEDKEKVEDTNKAEKPPISIEDIELLDLKINPPNAIGIIYVEAKFKNNSNVTVTDIKYTYKYDDEKHFLSSYKTLLPGDVSTREEIFGPSSGKLEDMELLNIEITCLDKDNQEIYVNYDTKLKAYDWY